ncbi:MAG: hypothetical protein JSW58_17620 [Candidatus Latescibacterota bacterium]|nr:MAG: hypothetical protein JSW58_17620 [Candidatus Latescibacterota bacterium]
MKSKKPPVVTSPWKIGIFVSLMLVFLSVGVTYFFVNKYGVTWNWQDKNEWLGVIKGEGFLEEILPLIALVVFTSLISYLVISGAVRKYRRYLESGLDYKNLLVSLKDIKDIEDTSKIERLRHQPELKRFLLSISQNVKDRLKELEEHQGETKKLAEEEVRAREEELINEFSLQCEALANAVDDGTEGGVTDELELSNPGLKRVSESVRTALAKTVREPVDYDAGPRDPALETSYAELRKASDVFRHRLQEIAEEMKQSGVSAKEIEGQLRSISAMDKEESNRARMSDARKIFGDILGSLKLIEELSVSLGVLSEEAKGLAISTALHAGSGEGTQEDLIRLAEEVKDMASRFNDAAKTYGRVTLEMTGSIRDLETRVGGDAADPDAIPSLERSIAGVQTKMALWVERVIVLSDKMANFQDSYSLSVSSLPDAATSTASVEADEQEVGASTSPEETEEFGFEALDRSRSIFGGTPEEASETPEKTPAEEGIFEKVTSENDMFTDLGEDRADAQTETRQTAMEDPTPTRDEVQNTKEPAQTDDKPTDLPGFESFARPRKPDQDPADVIPLETSGAEPGQQSAESETREAPREAHLATDTEDEKVIGLYELGAVDYDPAIHG